MIKNLMMNLNEFGYFETNSNRLKLANLLVSFSLTHVHSHSSSAFDLQLKAQKNENICAISEEISVK